MALLSIRHSLVPKCVSVFSGAETITEMNGARSVSNRRRRGTFQKMGDAPCKLASFGAPALIAPQPDARPRWGR